MPSMTAKMIAILQFCKYANAIYTSGRPGT